MPAPTTPHRHRPTAQRQAVMQLLHRSDRFRSAQQLHMELRDIKRERVGLSTVYRILRALAEERIAETQRAEDGETLYRLRTVAEHRHYLLCRRCGRAVGFTADDAERQADFLARQQGFTDVTHWIDVFGTCPLCT
jgi:Fur family transcriptional regulator, ferric uptake regulator